VREVSPSCGEHPGLNRNAHLEAFEDLEKDVVRERADSIFIAVLALQNSQTVSKFVYHKNRKKGTRREGSSELTMI
jgi:hypothetical protein